VEKSREIKVLSIVALVIAVFGMTLGFAAFSTTLSISSSATVTPDSNDFKVVMSGSETDPYESLISYVSLGGATADKGYSTGLNFTTSNVKFFEPGQKITYEVYIHNVGIYNAYIKELKFKNIDGYGSKKICTAVSGSGASQELVNEACEDIHIYFETFATGSKFDHYYDETFNYYNEILIGEKFFANIVIEYESDGNRVDGPFNVNFGDIEFIVKSTNE
jgi:hypothetical protein